MGWMPSGWAKFIFKSGVGIVGWTAQYHQPALVPDVRQDNRFNKKIDLVTGFTTRSILCVPVFSQKKSYGVLEVLNRKDGQFSPQDQEFMTLLGRQSAVAYQNLLLLEEVSHTKILFESLLENLTGGLIAISLTGTSDFEPGSGRAPELTATDQTRKPAPSH